MGDRAVLVLENGKRFEGEAFGARGDVMGEVVFTTGMTGYLETLTDPSYHGQIIVQTFPLIGNYGVIPEDFEGPRSHARAYIVRRWCDAPSNFRSQGDLDAFLRAQNIVGLCDIDTRALTKLLRERGVMNGRIVPAAHAARVDLDALRAHADRNPVPGVSTREAYTLRGDACRHRVALLDYGHKGNIARELLARGCEVTVLPHDAKAADIAALRPDGILLSNGPGDPMDNAGLLPELRAACRLGVPVFGICLGHQLLALAHGLRTEKLKYGHRGANQPAMDMTTGRTYITSQNHGYAVVLDGDAPGCAREWFRNVNDGTNEGLLYDGADIQSVQFHPEACGGPRDTAFLFDRFLARMKEVRHA